MKSIFLTESPYRKQARFIAIVWTLLIFVGCFYPSRELPRVAIPLIDKWTHFVLFGGFSFLWLCAYPDYTFRSLVLLFIVYLLLGSFIEVMQGQLTMLGRSMELMDAVADTVGGVLGTSVFCSASYFAGKVKSEKAKINSASGR